MPGVATRIDTKTRWGVLFVAMGGVSLAMVMGASCTKQPTQLSTLGSGGNGGAGGSGAGGGEGGSAPANQGQTLFTALEPTLYMTCGPGCHEAGGIADAPFLQGPDRYQSIISWPGIVVKDPSTSKIETIPVSSNPAHSFKFLDQSPLDTTLYPKLKAWLAAEANGIVSAKNDAGTGSAFVAPFVPIMGFNAVYLTPIGNQFTGMAITFNASLIDANVLALDDIEVQPTNTLGVHVVHPLFAVYPVGKMPETDPVDSFSNVDQYYQPGEKGTLGPGTLILTNWSPNAKLSLGFEKLELVQPMSMDAGDEGGTTGGGCKDVTSFMTNAQGQFKSNCVACHGGGNPGAQGAIDMSKIDSDPAAACAEIKNRVKPSDPPNSQIFITTDPNGNAAHPYKFGGQSSKFDAFKSSVSKWISAEQ